MQNAIPTGCGGGRKRRERDGKFLSFAAYDFYVGISITADSLMTLRYRVSPICRCGERESNFFFRVLFTKIKYISCRVCRRTERTAFQQTIKTILLRSLFSAPSSALPASLHYLHSISRAKNAAPVFFSMLNLTSYCYYLEL